MQLLPEAGLSVSPPEKDGRKSVFGKKAIADHPTLGGYSNLLSEAENTNSRQHNTGSKRDTVSDGHVAGIQEFAKSKPPAEIKEEEEADKMSFDAKRDKNEFDDDINNLQLRPGAQSVFVGTN